MAANGGLASKHAREMVKYAKGLGWEVHRQSKRRNHLIMHHPVTGQQTVISGTPGSQRAVTATKQMLRKYAHQEG